MFDLSISKLLILAVIALIVFGPNELPKVASQLGRILRDLRRIADGATAELKEGLGPEFQNFELEDLNPRRFVTKHLFDDETQRALFDDFKGTSAALTAAITGETIAANGTGANGGGSNGGGSNGGGSNGGGARGARATLGNSVDPPFDIEAT